MDVESGGAAGARVAESSSLDSARSSSPADCPRLGPREDPSVNWAGLGVSLVFLALRAQDGGFGPWDEDRDLRFPSEPDGSVEPEFLGGQVRGTSRNARASARNASGASASARARG